MEVEDKEDIFFMQPIEIILKYSLLTTKEIEVLQYCAKNADSFSIISKIKKPYTKIPRTYIHMSTLAPFEPYLIKQVVGAREWAGVREGVDNHRILNYYRCCKETRALLKEVPHLLLPLEYNLPEDICFYRKENPFFVTISHEKFALLVAPTQQDTTFFQEFLY